MNDDIPGMTFPLDFVKIGQINLKYYFFRELEGNARGRVEMEEMVSSWSAQEEASKQASKQASKGEKGMMNE